MCNITNRKRSNFRHTNYLRFSNEYVNWVVDIRSLGNNQGRRRSFARPFLFAPSLPGRLRRTFSAPGTGEFSAFFRAWNTRIKVSLSPKALFNKVTGNFEKIVRENTITSDFLEKIRPKIFSQKWVSLKVHKTHKNREIFYIPPSLTKKSPQGEGALFLAWRVRGLSAFFRRERILGIPGQNLSHYVYQTIWANIDQSFIQQKLLPFQERIS